MCIWRTLCAWDAHASKSMSSKLEMGLLKMSPKGHKDYESKEKVLKSYLQGFLKRHDYSSAKDPVNMTLLDLDGVVI